MNDEAALGSHPRRSCLDPHCVRVIIVHGDDRPGGDESACGSDDGPGRHDRLCQCDDNVLVIGQRDATGRQCSV
jgi:hypothetical protein